MSQFSVLVVGATGRQGGAVANHLLSGEYGDFDVHALTRSPESDRAQALANRGATLVEGNLLNKASLTPAVETVDAIYCVTIEVESGTTPTEAGIEAEIEQGTNMAEVAAEIGIEHFVFSSVAGAERDTGIPNFESKYDIEQRVHDLGLPATILRPVTIMQNYERQREVILNGNLVSPSPRVPRCRWSMSETSARLPPPRWRPPTSTLVSLLKWPAMSTRSKVRPRFSLT
ncbi:NmrA/HSCARG family protein [Haladaptatus pallidirubidus]|uniref:NmrA/HSCARG family protein n=1 Tax=Haladaptatus pallidirubidus TaxID=1008152 RepID=UPI0035EA7A91